MAKGVTVDSSVALSWVLPGEGDPLTEGLRDRAMTDPGMPLYVPPTFVCEVANALWVAVRRGRIGEDGAEKALEVIMRFRLQQWVPDALACLRLALESGRSAYDSVFLQVASESGTALWTVDGVLATAARRLDIEVQP